MPPAPIFGEQAEPAVLGGAGPDSGLLSSAELSVSERLELFGFEDFVAVQQVNEFRCLIPIQGVWQAFKLTKAHVFQPGWRPIIVFGIGIRHAASGVSCSSCDGAKV
jgi:hypothetical protein